MRLRDKSPLKVFVVGTILAALMCVAGLLFLNPPQCPANYTQEQVDASGCVIGANIGLGLIMMAAIAVEVVTVLVAFVMFIAHKKNERS